MARLPNRLPNYGVGGISVTDDGSTITFTDKDGNNFFSIDKTYFDLSIPGGFIDNATI